jgi:hypothetical protein
MRTRVGLIPILTLAAMTGAPALADDDHYSDQAIVVLNEGADVVEFCADHGVTLLASIDDQRTYLIQLPATWDEERFEEEIEEDDDRVDDADLNYKGETAEGQTESFYLLVDPPLYDDQYAWGHIGTGHAHGSSTGAGIVVAMLDTGIDAGHSAFAGLLAEGGYDFVDDDDDPADTGNGLDDDGDGETDEMVGHGTFMAGVVAKMAPDAKLLVVRVLDSDGQASSFRVAQGVYHAMARGADVINLSLTMEAEHEVLKDAIEDAVEAGIVVIASAGNLDSIEETQPAAVSETIAVASTDADDRKSEFSNYGGYVAISAPGSDVVSAVPGEQYGQWEGTSISAAMVAGAAALVRALDPDADPEAVKELLTTHVAPADPDYEGLLGSGRLDIGAVVDAMGGGGEPLGDLTGDGIVGTDDLLILLGAWGEAGSKADLDGDGIVGVSDLVILLANWT